MAFNNPTTSIPGTGVTGTITGNTVETASVPPRVALNDPAYPNQVIVQTANPVETGPAGMTPLDRSGNPFGMQFHGPTSAAVPAPATLDMMILDTQRYAQLSTDKLNLLGGTTYILGGTSLTLEGTNGGQLVVENAILKADKTWANLTRVNGWVDFAGSRAQYLRNAVGDVHVRGVVASGTAALIATLPASIAAGDPGYRPTQGKEIVLRGQTGAASVMVIVTVETTGAITVITNLAAAQVRLGIDFSFSVL